MLLSKKTLFRGLYHNYSIRSYAVSLSFIAFLIILVSSLKQGIRIFPRSDQRNSEIPKALHRVSHTDVIAFPLVKEFKVGWKMQKFDNEDARPVGFPIKDSVGVTKTNLRTKIIYLATTYFSEWNPKHYYFLHFGNEMFTRYPCAINDCYATKSPSDIYKADAVLFHVRDLEVYSIPRYRSPSQTWILYSMEPPWLEVKDMKRFNGVFNWTMSYRRNSDVLVKYGFIGRREVDADILSSRTILHSKRNRAVWYVSNCNTDSNRERYVEQLMKIYPVDIVGGCGVEDCRPAETSRCYAKMAKRYKFYLAFENAICQDYVTEKLFNSLEYYVIPVTLGGANYSRIAPKNSVINAMEFLSPEDLGQYLWKVSLNKTLYLSYFTWKTTYRSYLQPWMCDLCEKLHDSLLPKTRNDLESWWNEDGSCLRWTMEDFEPVEKHPFPQYNTKLFD